MKRLLTIAVAACLLLGMVVPAFATMEAVPINAPIPANLPIVVDGKEVATSNKDALLPLRAVAEAMGFTVTWHEGGSIDLGNGTYNTTIQLGNEKCTINTGIQDIAFVPKECVMAPAPTLIGKLTYVPMNLFSALLGEGEGAVNVVDGKIVIDTKKVQMPNPITEHESQLELEKAVNFKMFVPKVPEGFKAVSYSDINGTLAQIRYEKGEESILYRMSQGPEFNSGVFGGEDAIKWLDTTRGLKLFCRVLEDKVSVADWTTGGNAYSLAFGPGVTETIVKELADSVLLGTK